MASASFKGQEGSITRLVRVGEKATEVDPVSLGREKDLGKLSFEEYVPEFTRGLELIKKLGTLEYGFASPNSITRAAEAAESLMEVIPKIQGFDVSAGSSPEERDRIVDQWRNRFEGLHKRAGELLGCSVLEDGSSFQSELRKGLQEARDEAERQLQELRSKASSADQMVRSMRKVSSELAISKHASHFEDAAQVHRKTATKWIFAVAGASLALIAAAVTSLLQLPYPEDLDIAKSIQIAIGKLTVISVLYYVVVWTVRNYRAHRHNCVLNEHRRNALSTFEAFREGASDPETRNAILLRTTELIFAPGNSGYLRPETQRSNTSQMLEFVRHYVSTGRE